VFSVRLPAASIFRIEDGGRKMLRNSSKYNSTTSGSRSSHGVYYSARCRICEDPQSIEMRFHDIETGH
jgi:hypothetical protein